MIRTLIIIGVAIAWLVKETDFFMIRLQSYEYQKEQAELAEAQAETESKINASIPEDTEPIKPLVFIPLDMPEITGTLNIICERG